MYESCRSMEQARAFMLCVGWNEGKHNLLAVNRMERQECNKH